MNSIFPWIRRWIFIYHQDMFDLPTHISTSWESSNVFCVPVPCIQPANGEPQGWLPEIRTNVPAPSAWSSCCEWSAPFVLSKRSLVGRTIRLIVEKKSGENFNQLRLVKYRLPMFIPLFTGFDIFVHPRWLAGFYPSTVCCDCMWLLLPSDALNKRTWIKLEGLLAKKGKQLPGFASLWFSGAFFPWLCWTRLVHWGGIIPTVEVAGGHLRCQHWCIVLVHGASLHAQNRLCTSHGASASRLCSRWQCQHGYQAGSEQSLWKLF